MLKTFCLRSPQSHQLRTPSLPAPAISNLMFRTLSKGFSSAQRFFQAEEESFSNHQAALKLLANQRASSGIWLPISMRLLVMLGGVFACCLPIAWMLAALSRSEFRWWLSEAGPIELASGWGYLMTGLGLITVSLFKSVRHPQYSRPSSTATAQSLRQGVGVSTAMLGLCLVLLACREFDWHKLWTTGGVMKLSYYFDSSVAIPEKLLVVAVMGMIGWLLIASVSRHLRGFVADLRAGKSVAMLVAVGLLLLPISKVLDSSRRVFTSWVADIPQSTQMLVIATEELVELVIPICFLAACLFAFIPRRLVQRLFW